MKRLAFLLLCGLVLLSRAHAETYRITGVQESELSYQLVNEITPNAGMQRLSALYVLPGTFSSPTCTQVITDAELYFSPQPDSREETKDELGNRLVKVGWQKPAGQVRSTVRLTAKTSVSLSTARTAAPYPLGTVPDSARPYLEQTPLTSPGSSGLDQRALSLCEGKTLEEEAVQAILNEVADRMIYEPSPPADDAAFAFATGRGNCQGYANLAIAMLRTAGIPARAVSGVTWQDPFSVKAGRVRITMNMAAGRHAWIEVYFPDQGFIPYNPQNSQLFVSSRFLRLESGRDSREASRDGLISWTQPSNAGGQPQVREIITTALTGDTSVITGEKASPTPRPLMLLAGLAPFSAPPETTPQPLAPAPPDQEVTAFARPEAEAAAGAAVSEAQPYSLPVSLGNTQFPEGVDFAAIQGKVSESPDGTRTLAPSTLVETAEYVTSRGRQYAQAFVLNEKTALSDISLALKSFGSEGELWAEIYDDQDGRPGKLLATSEFKDLGVSGSIPRGPGYQWAVFPFTGRPLLSPGRYWVALGFSGPAIVNWFYTYGNPSRIPDPVAARNVFEQGWPEILANEFIFRVRGFEQGIEPEQGAGPAAGG
ncbi:MAG: transglutaminase domain-containing protein [Thermodesulfobacteriota bacterium]